MDDDYITTWAANTLLDQLLGGEACLACHVDDPTAAGLGSTELIGGGYVRQPISFSSAGNRARVSANPQVFSGLPQCTVLYLAVWTLVAGGRCVVVKKLATPIDVVASGQVIVPAGDIAVMF